MTEKTFDQHDQTVARQTNVAGDVVHGDKITVIGNHNVVGDHNVVTIIQNLVQGVRRLPTDYATRIQNFLVEYLGTPERPVPFGGRAAALADLDAWLNDASAPPYLLLTAPAGRGKSALLARWSQTLAQREDAPAVIFLPVSVRFRTNLSSVVFASLAARLAYLHGDEVPLTSESAEVWRGMTSSYLARPLPDGRPLLVLLDGVDEAADWDVGADLFPATPPPGLRIVLAARHTAERPTEAAWRQALGWERSDLARALDLTPLDRPGVADVLERMGVPLDVLARDVDVTAELHRLSAGDPLLVRLYVDDLWARGEAASRLRPEELRQIEPGLVGYFDRWWADQRALWGEKAPLKEPEVQALLNLLACALGPLTAEDVLTLAGDCGLNTWTLEEALRPLARFIVGAGRGKGYVFQHPKLGDYFYGRLTPAERRTWEGRFLDWGQSTLEALNAKTLPSREAPAYLVQYYGAHLERAHAPDEALYALVSEGWLRAWEALEGAYDGFLGDVARAWARAEAAHDLALQVKCALCQGSIAALSTNIPPELLSLAVKYGVLIPMQGLVIAQQIPDEYQRAVALTGLAPCLPPDLVVEALAAACVIKDEQSCAASLTGLALYLPSTLRAPALGKALTAARTIEDEHWRAHALTELLPYLPPEQHKQVLDEVRSAACAFKNEGWRACVLIELLPHLPPEQYKQVLAEGLTAARAIRGAYERAEMLTNLLPYLPPEQIEQVLSEALTAARTIRSVGDCVHALSKLAPYLPINQREQALVAAQVIVDKYWRVEALIGLAPHLPPDLREVVLAEALVAARAIRDEDARVRALTELAPNLPPDLCGMALVEALVAARAIRDEDARVRALTELVPYLSSNLMAEVLAAARALEYDWSRVDTLSVLAPYLPPISRRQVLAETLTTVLELPEEIQFFGSSRAEMLIRLIPHLSSDLIGEALIVARRLPEEGHYFGDSCRAKVLTKLMSYIPSEECKAVLAEALVAAYAIKSTHNRIEALIGLISFLPTEQRERVLPKLLAASRAIEDEQVRARALSGLALHLPPEHRDQALTEALVAARAIGNECRRASALSDVVPSLSLDLRDQVLTEALIAARAVQNVRRAFELTRLIPYLLPELRDQVLTEALVAARTIGDEDWHAIALSDGLLLDWQNEILFTMTYRKEYERWHRSPKLSRLASFLPPDLRLGALAGDYLTGREKDLLRNHALTGLVPHLAAWAERRPGEAYTAAYATLRERAKWPRPDFLSDLQALMPFLMALVPEDSRQQVAADIFHAIQDVCTWWP